MNCFEDFSVEVESKSTECIGEFFSDFTFITLTVDGDTHDDIFVFRVFFETKVEDGESERELLYNATNLEYETGIAKTSMSPYKTESFFLLLFFLFFKFKNK